MTHKDLENLNVVEEQLPTDVVNDDEITSVLSIGEEGKAQTVKETLTECVKTENLLTEEASKVVEKEGYSKIVIISVITLYLVGDVMKNLMDRKAVTESGVNHTVLPVVYAFLNIILAFLATMFFEGVDGTKSLFKWDTLKLFAIPAFFFACSQGTSLLVSKYLDAGAKKVLNQLRIPLTALIGRFIMGSSYTTLQWLGMSAVLAGCACFHFLTQQATSEVDTSKQSSMMIGIVFLVVQNMLAVIGSLFAEKFLKSQKKVAFYKQKFQIELWGMFAGIFMWIVIMPYVFGGLLTLATSENQISDKEVTALRARFVTYKMPKSPESPVYYSHFNCDEPHSESECRKNKLAEIYPIPANLDAALDATALDDTEEEKAKIAAEKAKIITEALNKRLSAEKKFEKLSKIITSKDLNGKNITLLTELEGKAAELSKECKAAVEEDKKVCALQYKFVRNAINGEKEMKHYSELRNFNAGVQTFGNSDVTTKSDDLKNKINFYTTGVNNTKDYETATKDAKQTEEDDKLCAEMTDAGVECPKKAPKAASQADPRKFNTIERVNLSTFTKGEGEDMWMQDQDYKLVIKEDKTSVFSYCNKALTLDAKTPKEDAKTPKDDCQTWESYIVCEKDVTAIENSGAISVPTSFKCKKGTEEEDVTFVSFPGTFGYGTKVKSGKICDPKNCGDQVTENTKYFYQKRAFTASPFYGFELVILLSVIANLLQSWMSGLISKVLSSLMKNIFAAVATALIVVCEIFMGNKANTVPVYSAIVIVILTALVFGQLPKAAKKN